jgi:hypothetical protein
VRCTAVAIAALIGGATQAHAEPGSTTTDGDTYVVHAAPDGEVQIEDSRNLRFGARGATYSEHDYDANVDDRPIEPKTPDIGVTIATFDVTDWLMRGHGHDPYASKKLATLDASRDARVVRGQKLRDAQLAHASTIMQANLDHLWATVRDPAARKQAVFEMWDECADTGPDTIVAAGAAARARLESFVYQTLPAGSPGAFTAADLARLNAHRQSHAAFAPYGG